jgi:hypothetical protein
MFEAQKVSVNEIRTWRNRIKNGDLSDVGAVYQQLAERGYHYASWAYGVESADTITGHGALEFMQAVATEKQHILTQDQTNKIRKEMAMAYLDTLEKNAGAGSISQDISYKEMREFHISVFNNNNLDINYWTLYEPMRLIERYASAKLPNGQVLSGENIVELLWERMWKTGGTVINGLSGSYELFNIVKDIKGGHIYIDKITGMPTSTTAINLYWYTEHLGTDQISPNPKHNGYAEITISASDQAVAANWINNTKMVDSFKNFLVEHAREGSQNLWYKDYVSPFYQYTGSYFANQKNTDAEQQQFRFN